MCPDTSTSAGPEMAGRQSTPSTGNAPHGRIQRGPDCKPLKEHLRRSLSRRSVTATIKSTGRPVCVFSGITESFSPMNSFNPNLDRSRCLPPGSSRPKPRTRREDRALLIVPMSSDRLFLDRVGRHQSPSPLRRQAQINTHFASACLKPELSTLLESGTFYFALTQTELSNAG